MRSNLRDLRIDANLTLKELADLSGLSKGQISQLETGVANPRLNTAYAISTVLGVSITDIWPNDLKVEETTITVRRLVRPGETPDE